MNYCTRALIISIAFCAHSHLHSKIAFLNYCRCLWGQRENEKKETENATASGHLVYYRHDKENGPTSLMINGQAFWCSLVAVSFARFTPAFCYLSPFLLFSASLMFYRLSGTLILSCTYTWAYIYACTICKNPPKIRARLNITDSFCLHMVVCLPCAGKRLICARFVQVNVQ